MLEAGEQGDFVTMARLNLEFHEQLATASGNAFLLQMLIAVHDRVRRFPGTTFAHGQRWREAVEEHGALLTALRSRDPEASAKLARAHMNSARDVRIATLDD